MMRSNCDTIIGWVAIASTFAWCHLDCLLTIIGTLLFVALLVSSFGTTRPFTKHTKLRLERCSDGKRQLLQDFRVTVMVGKDEQREITVPAGFKTDFSSIPSALQWTMHWTKVDVAGVVHDWLYANAQTLNMTKLQTDRIWWDIARSGEIRAHPVQAAAGWLALITVGCLVWLRYKKNQPGHLFPSQPFMDIGRLEQSILRMGAEISALRSTAQTGI